MDEKGNNVVIHRDPNAVLNVDGLDPAHHIAVEFASRDDFWDLDGPWRAEIHGTAFTVDTRSVATYLRERADGSDANVYFGAFYDPLVLPEPPQSENRPRAVAESKRLLREQVKDFAAWLKAQGAI